MKTVVLAILLFFSQNCISQMRWEGAAFLQDANGNWVDPKPFYKTEGSPFFNDAYAPARLTLGNKTYVVQAKLNLADNTVHFDADGTEMVSAKAVDRVEFYHRGKENQAFVFKSGFPSIGKNSNRSYYQVLDSGKATLLKHIRIRKRETVPYNTATRLTIYDKDDQFYIYRDNKMWLVKKIGDLLEATNDKRDKIKSMIQLSKIRIHDEGALQTVIEYYNSL